MIVTRLESMARRSDHIKLTPPEYASNDGVDCALGLKHKAEMSLLQSSCLRAMTTLAHLSE